MRDFHLPGRSGVFASEGMCATSHPLAAKVAIDVLQSGGNAVDAAIAGAVLLGLCEPQMTGIGGDCFALIGYADGRRPIESFNGSGRAPQALNAENLRTRGFDKVPTYGVEAVTVPGAVDLFCHLSETRGQLALGEILAPSITYAERGIPVAPRVAFDWQEDINILQGAARDHYTIGGQAPATGAVFRSPGQAEVLRRIAAQGRAGFYEGEVADDMISTLRALGGLHSAEDFASHTHTTAAPVRGNYADVDLVEHPPNGQGATAILLLNILSQFDIARMQPYGTERAHIEAEAVKLAYDARNRFVADGDYTEALERMLSMDTARQLAALIDPKRAMESPAELSEAIHKDTVYITVVDRDRMAVSLIYSIFHGFGSGIASNKFGILFQNRGAGFTLQPGHPNELMGGKRPMHTIIPAMLAHDERVLMPFGVMGGGYQPNGHARLVSNLRDFGMDLQTAMDGPRCFAEAGELRVERGYEDAVRQELADMGHKVVTPRQPIGGSQAILIREDGILHGASDHRKDGCALGY